VEKFPRAPYLGEASLAMRPNGERSRRKKRKNVKSGKNSKRRRRRKKRRNQERILRDLMTDSRGKSSTENPESPENPGNPEETENPEETGSIESPENPESPEEKGSPESPENPESLEEKGSPESPENPESPEETGSPEGTQDSDTMTEIARDTITREDRQGPITETEIIESLASPASLAVVIAMQHAETTPAEDKIEKEHPEATDHLSIKDLDPIPDQSKLPNQLHQQLRKRRSPRLRHNPQNLLMTKRRRLLPRGQ